MTDDAEHVLVMGLAICQRPDPKAYAVEVWKVVRKGWDTLTPDDVARVTCPSCRELMQGAA